MEVHSYSIPANLILVYQIEVHCCEQGLWEESVECLENSLYPIFNSQNFSVFRIYVLMFLDFSQKRSEAEIEDCVSWND